MLIFQTLLYHYLDKFMFSKHYLYDKYYNIGYIKIIEYNIGKIRNRRYLKLQIAINWAKLQFKDNITK